MELYTNTSKQPWALADNYHYSWHNWMTLHAPFNKGHLSNQDVTQPFNCDIPDRQLSLQTNTSLSSMLCPHSHAPWKNFPGGYPSQCCSRLSTLNFRVPKIELPKRRCILLVYVVPIKSFKLSLTVQSHTCTVSESLSFWCGISSSLYPSA